MEQLCPLWPTKTESWSESGMFEYVELENLLFIYALYLCTLTGQRVRDVNRRHK